MTVKAQVDVHIYANRHFLGTSTNKSYWLPEDPHKIQLVNEKVKINERRFIRIVPSQAITISPQTDGSQKPVNSTGAGDK